MSAPTDLPIMYFLTVMLLAGSAAGARVSLTAPPQAATGPLPPVGLAADHSNLEEPGTSSRFAIGALPTLTWQGRHTSNGETQSAYQIQVMQSHKQHGRDAMAVHWDSGKVQSTSSKVEFSGRPLLARLRAPGVECYLPPCPV